MGTAVGPLPQEVAWQQTLTPNPRERGGGGRAGVCGGRLGGVGGSCIGSRVAPQTPEESPGNLLCHRPFCVGRSDWPALSSAAAPSACALSLAQSPGHLAIGPPESHS